MPTCCYAKVPEVWSGISSFLEPIPLSLVTQDQLLLMPLGCAPLCTNVQTMAPWWWTAKSISSIFCLAWCEHFAVMCATLRRLILRPTEDCSAYTNDHRIIMDIQTKVRSICRSRFHSARALGHVADPACRSHIPDAIRSGYGHCKAHHRGRTMKQALQCRPCRRAQDWDQSNPFDGWAMICLMRGAIDQLALTPRGAHWQRGTHWFLPNWFAGGLPD